VFPLVNESESCLCVIVWIIVESSGLQQECKNVGPHTHIHAVICCWFVSFSEMFLSLYIQKCCQFILSCRVVPCGACKC